MLLMKMYSIACGGKVLRKSGVLETSRAWSSYCFIWMLWKAVLAALVRISVCKIPLYLSRHSSNNAVALTELSIQPHTMTKHFLAIDR